MKDVGYTLIRGGRVIDPASGRDAVGDVLVRGERIELVADAIAVPAAGEDWKVIEAQGLLVVPGLIDMHVHLREPGDEEEETIRSGARAAIAGGVTAVAAFPNTEPAVDNEAAAEFVVTQGKRAGYARVFPVGCVTLGRDGKELAEMAGLVRAGAVAFSDADRSIRSAEIMRRGLLYARMFDRPVIAHCEDMDLRRNGVMNYGRSALRLGLAGIPDVSEDIVLARDISLAEITRGKLHVSQMSTRGSVEHLRRAKDQGLDVTGEVTPHHFSLTDEACSGFDPNYKVLPPLRAKRDIEGLIAGLREGVIDVIASGHAPHAPEEKAVEFDYAPFGTVGLETLFAATYTALVGEHGLPLSSVIEKLTLAPARRMGLDGERGSLARGKAADISVFDLEEEFTVEPERFVSKSRNSCFVGMRLRGRPREVLVGGRHVLRAGRLIPDGVSA